MQCRLPRRIGTVGNGVNYVEYIESSGTQYIDTGFKPNSNTRIVIDLDIESKTNQQALFGARTAYKSNWFALYTYPSVSGYEDGYANQATTPTATYTGRVLIDKNKNATSVNGAQISSFTSASFTAQYTLYLLSLNNAGTDFTVSCPTYAKLYSCQIYDNGTLVRDFRPALDPDGVACLYEKVSKTYYYNKGTGTFTAGASISGGGSGGGGSSEAYTLTITNSDSFSSGYVKIGETQYSSAATVSIASGTEITVFINYRLGYERIYLDGVVKAQVTNGSNKGVGYTFTPTSDLKIDFGYYASGDVYAAIITTE